MGRSACSVSVKWCGLGTSETPLQQKRAHRAKLGAEGSQVAPVAQMSRTCAQRGWGWFASLVLGPADSLPPLAHWSATHDWELQRRGSTCVEKSSILCTTKESSPSQSMMCFTSGSCSTSVPRAGLGQCGAVGAAQRPSGPHARQRVGAAGPTGPRRTPHVLHEGGCLGLCFGGHGGRVWRFVAG